MKYFDLLHQIQSRLQIVNGFENEHLVTDFLSPSKAQNSLLVKEGSEGAEILVCLDEAILKKYESIRLPHEFEFRHLPDLSIVIEELSHFNTYCRNAAEDQPLSQLELEVQGEVDKFAVALEWLSEKNEEEFKHKLFDVLFDDCQLGNWVRPDQVSRYRDAHQIAKNFCRKILREDFSSEQRRKSFKDFFETPLSQKAKL